MGKRTAVLKLENITSRRIQVLSRTIGMCTYESNGARCKRPVARNPRYGKKEGLCPMHHAVWAGGND